MAFAIFDNLSVLRVSVWILKPVLRATVQLCACPTSQSPGEVFQGERQMQSWPREAGRCFRAKQ